METWKAIINDWVNNKRNLWNIKQDFYTLFETAFRNFEKN